MSPWPCAVPGCARPQRARGFCDTHYRRVRRDGTPGHHLVRHEFSPRQRCDWLREVRTEQDPRTGCWTWTGSINHTGYAKVLIGKRTHYAHRIFYETIIGPVPPGLELDHVCVNRACVNPFHLEPVTHLVNVRRGAARRKAKA